MRIRSACYHTCDRGFHVKDQHTSPNLDVFDKKTRLDCLSRDLSVIYPGGRGKLLMYSSVHYKQPPFLPRLQWEEKGGGRGKKSSSPSRGRSTVMSPAGRKRTTAPAAAVTARPAKRVRLPDYAGGSSSTSRPRPGRLGSPVRHGLDNSGTTAVRSDRGSRGFPDAGLLVADDPDASGARPGQPLSKRTVSSPQSSNAKWHSSLPSSFLPHSTFQVASRTGTVSLLTQDTAPSDAPDEQGRADLPTTLSKYERKLKKFFGQWHASLVKQGIPEHLVCTIAKRCVQINDEEGAPGTDSHTSRVKPLLPPSTDALLGGTQLFQASTQVSPGVLDDKDDDEDGNNDNDDTPSRPSPNLILTQAPQTNDELVVIQLGAGGRASKQGLGGDHKPATLVEALRAKLSHGGRKNHHHEEGGKSFDILAVARRLQGRDFGGRLSSQEICVIGMAVLHEVFGSQGQRRLASALMHLYGRHPQQHLADLNRNAGRVADEIRKQGPVTLSNFTRRWAQAVQHDGPNISTIDDIRLIDMKVSLVREWDRWSSQAATESNGDIEDFLAKNGIGANTGLALATRISKYLSRKLGLPEGALPKKIYAWRPLTVMADVFGAGSYVFVSRSLFTCYNKIRATDGIKKEDKFRAMALAVADELPDLLEICEASYTYVVQPALKAAASDSYRTQNLVTDLRVPGIQMAIGDDLSKLRKTSISELLGVYIPLIGSVEELENATEEDDDEHAETGLVRRQSIPYEHDDDDNIY
jgi:hypothetical protein